MEKDEPMIAQDAFFKLTYGLFVLTSADNGRMNGCIINTAQQLTDDPKRVAIAVNRANYTRVLIFNTGVFNISVLTESAPFDYFKHFGFQSGKQVDKFEGFNDYAIASNGLPYMAKHTNAYISARVIASEDHGSHTLFVADVTEAKTLSAEPSATYGYYFSHIKPKSPMQSPPKKPKLKRWVCSICGYVYEGEELPPDFVCPCCNHGAQYFELMETSDARQQADLDNTANAAASEEKAGSKRWVCSICGYVYEGEELPPDFVCPCCNHGAQYFEPTA